MHVWDWLMIIKAMLELIKYLADKGNLLCIGYAVHGRVTANYALLHRIVLEMASRAVRLFLSLQLRLQNKMGFQGGAPRENL